MSTEGIKKAAKVFELMQQTRHELLSRGMKPNENGMPDYQDILLGQMLEDGKDAMKAKFEKLTLMKNKD